MGGFFDITFYACAYIRARKVNLDAGWNAERDGMDGMGWADGLMAG